VEVVRGVSRWQMSISDVNSPERGDNIGVKSYPEAVLACVYKVLCARRSPLALIEIVTGPASSEGRPLAASLGESEEGNTARDSPRVTIVLAKIR
jgi:hypothetical protein